MVFLIVFFVGTLKKFVFKDIDYFADLIRKNVVQMGLDRGAPEISPIKPITHNPNYGLWIKGFSIQLVLYTLS